LGDGLFVADSHGRYVDVNPAGCRMLGYSREDLLQLSLADVVDPSELQRLADTVAEMADLRLHRSEWLFRRKDGTTFVGELVGGQLPDGTLQSVVRDVTQRLERETVEQTLRREAAHRTKNVLAVVQAILRRMSPADPATLSGRLEARLHALAASNDIFIREGWKEIGLEDLVWAQLSPFAGEANDQIEVGGPAVSVAPPAAQAIGIALHELATNASKYGSLSARGGKVGISWGVAGTGATATFAMEWREREGPLVSPPSRTGFGSDMIVEMTRRALGARSTVSYDPSGLVWTLECPLSALARS